jgi:hypothetical protein
MAQAAPKGKLEVENLDELMNNTPTPPWVLGGVLPEQAILLVSGLGHTSKTFMALDAIASVASGTPWLGHFPTKYGRALYVGEDSSRSDVVRQVRKLLWGKDLVREPPTDDMLFTVCKGAMLTSDDEAARIADLVFRHNPALLVLDSLRFLTPGTDEDSSTEMSAVMDRVKALRDLGPAIILVHHNSLGNRPRGSTAIFDAVDGAINLRYDKTKDRVTAKIEKRRCIEVQDFVYHHLWDEIKAVMVVLEGEAKLSPEAQAVLAMFRERGECSTADAVACCKVNGNGFDKLAPLVLANRVDRLLQVLKREGYVKRTSRGHWVLDPRQPVAKT